MNADKTLVTLRSRAPRGGQVSVRADLSPAEQRLERVQALGERIGGHVRFMCAPGACAGTSDEAKEKALAAFYARLVLVEQQLALIVEQFQLE